MENSQLSELNICLACSVCVPGSDQRNDRHDDQPERPQSAAHWRLHPYFHRPSLADRAQRPPEIF